MATIELTEEEIVQKYDALFIDATIASTIPKSNPFAFSMYQCINSRITVFEEDKKKFISTYDFILFCKKFFLDVDLKRIESVSFRI